MTQQNKKVNIAQELERAKDCLKSAELLVPHGQYADAVSRLYYYVYHSIRALLFSKGLEPKTHEGTLRLLGMHFIKPGIFETSFSHNFAKLMKYRGEADYNPSYVFTKEDYEDFKNEAEEIHNKIIEFLEKEKLI
jgi:uncharacterized protein (UPF0332 family)